MVLALVQRMDRREIDAHVITLAPPGPIAMQLRKLGLRVSSLGGRGSLLAFLRLARVLRRERFDVLAVYGFRACAVVRLLRPLVFRQTRFVRAVRGRHVSAQERTDTPTARALLKFEVVTSGLVHAYDANSQGAVDLLAGAGIPPAKLRCIPNGIDVSRWPRHENTNRTPSIVCVARFVGVKRHADLVVAASLLRRQGLDFRLVLAGDGPTRPAIQRLVAEHGLYDVTSFTGSLELPDIAHLLAEAFAFCLPSAGEGMPGSVLEAMACQLPVVGTRVNGIEDLVVEGETGLLVAPAAPEALALALATLLQDPALARQLGEAGRRRAERRFGIDRMVAAKQDLYRSLVIR